MYAYIWNHPEIELWDINPRYSQFGEFFLIEMFTVCLLQDDYI